MATGFSDDDDDIFGDLEFEDSPKSKPSKKKAPAKKKKGGKKGAGDGAGEPEGKEVMTAQERIAAMKARLAGIRATDLEEEPKKTKGGVKAGAAKKQAKPLVRFSEAPGLEGDDELYFEDDDEYDVPAASAKKTQSRPAPPKKAVAQLPTADEDDFDDFVDDLVVDDDEDLDVPEVDTRIRSTMALEKHWSDVEEKRKREEALRKRKLKEKQAERMNEEQRLLLEIQEKKRREEDMRRRLAEEDGRRMQEDWKRKEEEKRKKFDAKMKAKDLQLQRLEEARKKREDHKKKLTDEMERRRREYEAEMSRLTTEENELIRKIAEEEEARTNAIRDEERRREQDEEARIKAEEERQRKEAEEEMRMLEEEEKELLRREQEIERELQEKRRLREEKLRSIQSALQTSQSRREEEEQRQRVVDSPDDILYFCMHVGAAARRIKGTVYHGVFTGSAGVDLLMQIQPDRREAKLMGQRLLEAGVFWPIEGDESFDDSARLYNLEDSHEIVIQAREELSYAEESAPAAAAVSAAPPARNKGGAAQAASPPPVVEEEPEAEYDGPLGELRVLDDAGQQLPNYQFELWLGDTVIGRRSDNAISLPVLSVSKKHAMVTAHEDGSFTVTDLGSSNKTRLFSTPSAAAPVVLRPHEPYTVYSGAEMLFGEIRCTITSLLVGQEEYEFFDQDDEEPEAALERFSVAPPMDAAPLPPGASAALAPRSVVNRKKR